MTSVALRLPEPEVASYQLPGFGFSLVSDDQDIHARVRSAFEMAYGGPGEDLVIEVLSAANGYRVDTGDGCRLEQSAPIAADWVIWEATRRALSTTTYGVALHAAAVCVDDRAMLLAGPSTVGKSTLTAHLLRQGAAYLSDEAVILRQDGRVTGFPRSIALETRGKLPAPLDRDQPAGSSKEYYAASFFGAPTISTPMRAVAVCLLSRQATTADGQPLPIAEVLPGLLPQVFPTGPAEQILGSLSRLLARTPVFSFQLTDPAGDADRLLQRLRSIR